MEVLRRIYIFNNKDVFQLQHCDVCPLSRQTRLPFPVSSCRAIYAFHLIHLDVWGPYNVETHNRMKYCLTVVDDCTRWTWIFLLRLKSDVSEVLKNFITMVFTHL